MRTIIKDTCCCGAGFEVNAHQVDAKKQHEAWLEAHAVCRERHAASGVNRDTLITINADGLEHELEAVLGTIVRGVPRGS